MAKSNRSSRRSTSGGKRASPSKQSGGRKRKSSPKKPIGASGKARKGKSVFKKPARKTGSITKQGKLAATSSQMVSPGAPPPVKVDYTTLASGSHQSSSVYTAAPGVKLPSQFRKERVGRLLRYAISKLEEAGSVDKSFAAHLGVETQNGNAMEAKLPVILKLSTEPPKVNETYKHYKERVEEHLAPIQEKINQLMGIEATPLITANALKLTCSAEQVAALTRDSDKKIQRIELDPVLQLVYMDNAIRDIGAPEFRTKHPGRDGKGVKVAVLDSGIDMRHPFLKVLDSVSTCGESVDIPGKHGTHCAGSIASLDDFYPGVAPGASLLNIKVLTADGRGTHSNVTQGIDRAVEMGADILSMSLGFNHLPPWSEGGHGWECNSGHCPLCTAVDNVSRLDHVVVVVAAGNEHNRAEQLRHYGYTFDTELGCPGQAREAITVGATYKSSSQFMIAEFSSHGPTSYGKSKPNLVAPGVNITSTIPVPRDANGAPVAHANRIDLFGRDSGTSMATPIVAGAVALIVQRLKDGGMAITNKEIKRILYTEGVIGISGGDANVVGLGRLDISGLS